MPVDLGNTPANARPPIALETSISIQSESSARELLTRMGVDPAQHTHLHALAHGHPRALALLAGAAARDPDADLTWASQPGLVQDLLAELVPSIPDDAHREALWCAAIVLRTSEEMLARLTAPADARALFAWLGALPCMRSDADGLFPDDLVRDLLDADLRWRRPQRRRELLTQVAQHFVELLRKDPSLRRAAIRAVWFAWREELRYFRSDMLHASVTTLRPHDLPALEAIVLRHLGPESLACFSAWVRRDARGAVPLVVRGAVGEVCGLALFLGLADVSPEDAVRDPGLAPLYAALGPSGRIGTRYLRFFLDREHGLHASPTAAAISAYAMERAISTPGLTNVFSAWTPPELGLDAMGKGANQRFSAGDFSLDGRAFGVMRMTVDGAQMLDWFIERYVVPLAQPEEPGPRLSPRERETLALLVQGKTEKEIAVALELSAHTVHQYVKSLYRLFGVTTRGALVARALKGRIHQ